MPWTGRPKYQVETPRSKSRWKYKSAFILPLSSFGLSVMLLFPDFCSDRLAGRWVMALSVWYTEIPHIVAARCGGDRKAWWNIVGARSSIASTRCSSDRKAPTVLITFGCQPTYPLVFGCNNGFVKGYAFYVNIKYLRYSGFSSNVLWSVWNVWGVDLSGVRMCQCAVRGCLSVWLVLECVRGCLRPSSTPGMSPNHFSPCPSPRQPTQTTVAAQTFWPNPPLSLVSEWGVRGDSD